MKTLHTKGEWKIRQFQSSLLIETEDTVIADLSVWTNRECHEANAKLIASAPDLLEYCIASYVLLRDNKEYFPKEKIDTITLFMESMERIIKKATE